MMEHRLSIRNAVRANAVLEHFQLGRLRVRVRNIGFGGVYLEAKPPLPPLNAAVDLVITERESNVRRVHRLEAMVIRQDGHGIALMFDDLQPEIYRQAVAALALQHRDFRRRAARDNQESTQPPLSTTG